MSGRKQTTSKPRWTDVKDGSNSLARDRDIYSNHPSVLPAPEQKLTQIQSRVDLLELRLRKVRIDEPGGNTPLDDLTFQAVIRDYARLVMKVNRKRVPSSNGWLYSPLPGPPDDPSIDPVGIEGFTLAWRHNVGCRYNLLAAQNFAISMLNHETYGNYVDKEEKERIEKGFLQYAEHLYHIYSKQVNPFDFNECRDRANARIRGRKHSLHKARMSEAVEWKNGEIVRLVSALGIDGMSSDDDANETGSHSIIPKSNWRSAEVTQLLRLLDIGHGEKTSGTSRRPFRIRSVDSHHSRTSDRPAPKKLPINCYTKAYLDSLSEFDRNILEPAKAIEFEIPTVAIRWMSSPKYCPAPINPNPAPIDPVPSSKRSSRCPGPRAQHTPPSQTTLRSGRVSRPPTRTMGI